MSACPSGKWCPLRCWLDLLLDHEANAEVKLGRGWHGQPVFKADKDPEQRALEKLAKDRWWGPTARLKDPYVLS
jgi:hypothetical protein